MQDVIQAYCRNNYTDNVYFSFIMYQNGKSVHLGDWFAVDKKIVKLYKPDHPNDWSGLIWPGNGTLVPSDTPRCGWKNELCEQDSKDNKMIIIFTSLSGFIFVATFVATVLCVRKYRFEAGIKAVLSVIIDWCNVTLDQDYTDGNDSTFVKGIVNHHGGMSVMVEKLENPKIDLNDRKILISLKVMQELQHENVCHFVGVITQAPNTSILMSFESRGSLKHVIAERKVKLTWDFKVSLATDIACGMWYIHQSAIGPHCTLTSSKCVIDSRWICKITGHGLSILRKSVYENPTPKKLLWTAPELLRQGIIMIPSKECDVYSYSIILQELLLEELPFSFDNSSTEAANIIKKVTEKASFPFRPKLPHDQLPNKWITLINECWCEDISVRPTFHGIIHKLNAINEGKCVNLIDNMVNLLEHYTRDLELSVIEKSNELVEEQLKMEKLLYELLPKNVVHQLTLGRLVEPESFEGVTLLFSDIVGFTSISAKASPMDIVELLNNMYTLFDDISQLYDVYKVATIGDAYMVASGVPIRNEDRHAQEICSLSLALLSSIEQFRIPHCPDQILRMRIGIHSGPCIGGVVGVKMPRYLLFGDTVDIASKMESRGESMRIHISGTTALLVNNTQYNVEYRGQVDMKGIQTIDTYWLQSMSDNAPE